VEGKVYLFASKGGWSRMGVYVTHFSLFLFAIGAQIGVWGGMKGFAQIPEGQSIREITLRDGKAKALDFEVRCDKFDVTFYPDPATGQPSGRPKDYVSQLTVLENGQVVRQQTVEVNHPLIYKGIYFYQSSYGQTGATAGYLSVYGERRNLLASGAKLPKGGALDLEGGTQLRMLDMTSDYAGSGPAALVALEKPGVGRMEPQVLRRAEGAPTAVGEYLVRLDGVEAKMYTGLQVAKDPGVPVIWAGCILITVGLLMAFFVSHKRVWVRVTPTSGGAEVLVAGNVSRNRVGFETWFSDLTESAQKSLAG
jgi:cytochrome c biogenesis protein